MSGRWIFALIALVVAALAAATPAAAEENGPSPMDCDPFALEGSADSSSARLSEQAALAGEVEPNVAAAYQQAIEANEAPATRRARATGPVRVPVYVHVVQATAGPSIVPESRITNQITVLNNSFGGVTGGDNTGFVFELIDTDVTANPAWVNLEPDTPAEVAMKTSLREGGVRSLNLYLVDLGTFLGWATFPDEYAGNPSMDGVVVEKDSVPGGSEVPYNLGDTATHEIGHWLGLFHTFQGGCGPPGDLVDDTEPESMAHFSCSTTNSCDPLDGQPDPGDNFMSYADDACMFRFTPGQGNRAHDQTAEFRNGAPVGAATQAINAEAGGAKAVDVTATDPDGDALTYAVTDAPAHGDVSGSGPSLTYKAKRSFTGADSFTVQATDVYGQTATTQVNVDVKAGKVKLKAKAKKKQKLGKLAVTGSCGSEGCSLTATGKILATGPSNKLAKKAKKSFKLKRAKAKAPAGGQGKLKLKLSKSKQRKLLALLGDGWKAKANVKVTGTDDAGNSSSATAKITVKR